MRIKTPSPFASVLYVILACAFLAISVLGVTYLLQPENADKLFLRVAQTRFTKFEAAYLMIPLGVLLGGLLGYTGTLRLHREEDGDNAPLGEQHREETGQA